MLKAILFDFDGTLVDSVPLIYNLYLQFLQAYGKQGSWEEFHELNGYSGSELIAILKERHQITGSSDEMLRSVFPKLLEAYSTSITFYPGTLDFLTQLKASGLRLAIVTSASRPLVGACLVAHKLEGIFEAVITPEGLPRAKPDPAIYLRALETLNLAPEETLGVEDSVHGLNALIAAKIPAIAMIHDVSIELPAGVAASVGSWEELADQALLLRA